jgi:hypothetical protein
MISDFEKAYLPDELFPSVESSKALSLIERRREAIGEVASEFFLNNRAMFRRIGMDKGDIVAIFTAYAYSFFAKKQVFETFHEFLHKQSIRLQILCELKMVNEVEEVVVSDLNAFSHNENPEHLLANKIPNTIHVLVSEKLH